MSRIASKKLYRIDLGDGEWIDIKDTMSFAEFEELTRDASETPSTKEKITQSMNLARAAVKDWCIKDDEGNPVPYTPEKLTELDLKTMLELQKIIGERYGVSKKNETA